MVLKEKKCTPLRCKTFGNKANRVESFTTVDRVVTTCSFRNKDNSCSNKKESFKGVYY